MSTPQTTPERKPVGKIELKPGAHVHFMGICGTAMASLAGLLKDRGFNVTGSDQNVYPPMSTQLEKIGIKLMEGYKKENLSSKPDLVIVGNVISRQYEEAQALLASDIPFTSLPQAMGQIVIADRHCINVSGTHGKTTTTSLISWVTDQLGLKPGFLVGGIPKNFDFSYRVPQGDWFVIEGDEYDTAFFDKVPKFTHYRPRSVILTSVEFDHADIYRDLDHVKEAFQKLLQLIPRGGTLVTAAEDANIADLLKREAKHLGDGRKVVTFGMTKGDYQARNVRADGAGTDFEIHREGKADVTVKMSMIGEYNVKNALAAFALCETLGFDMQKVLKAIETFQGVKRRQEIIGKPNDITIIEDFAHHPTAVKQTIQTVQARYPKSKVFSVFEFRSATSRRNVFQDDYADALSIAHALMVPPAFNQAAIAEEQRFSVDKLLEKLKAKGVDANLCNDVDDIVAKLKAKAKPGDVVLIMSNGGFGGIYEKLLKQLA
ncbi:MAG: UDP-N-acetylmuramate:L-alanyl-gamma-D-glutamyl-meso-diaminopimelate ligase [Bdellovibrionota bacterium]